MSIVSIYLLVALVPVLVLGVALGLEQVERVLLGTRKVDVVPSEPLTSDGQPQERP